MGFGRDRLPQALAALLCSAVLFYLGTGLTPVAALTWLAPLPVLWLAPRLSWPAAAGVAFGAYLLGTANSWVFQARSHDTPLWPIGAMIDVGMSVVFLLTVLAFRSQLRRNRPLVAVCTAPAVWTGALYVVSVSNPLGLGGTFANLQADTPVVLQSATVAGMWGVEFLVMLAPSAVAVLLTSVAGRVRAAVVAAVVLALALGAGAVRLAVTDAGPTRRVAAVATNQHVWGPGLDTAAGRDLVSAYVDQIAALPEGVRTVVLPEQSFSAREARPAALVDPMRAVAKSRDLDIVVGFAYNAGTAKYNYALLFPAGGGEPLTYLKHHDQVSPPGHDLVFSPSAPVGVEICLDVNLTDPTRDYAAAGAELLAIPASDETDNGWQRSRAALLRGMASGLPVVWSDRTGVSMITDGLGRVLADAPTGGSGPFTTVVADVPVGPGATVYTRLGDWFAWLCLALALVPLLIRGSRRRAASGSPAAEPYAPHPTVASHG
jgi:apolipoprotein N-acyltransferase